MIHGRLDGLEQLVLTKLWKLHAKMTMHTRPGASIGQLVRGFFDTAAEAAYPMLLAQRAAACMLNVVTQRHLSLQAPPRLHDLATAAQGKQTKRHPPLIPEFHHFTRKPVDEPLQPGTKLLAPHLGGNSREELQTEGGDQADNGEMRTMVRLTRNL